jgi:hypothetical protein
MGPAEPKKQSWRDLLRDLDAISESLLAEADRYGDDESEAGLKAQSRGLGEEIVDIAWRLEGLRRRAPSPPASSEGTTHARAF